MVDQVEDLVETFIRERLSDRFRTARTLSNCPAGCDSPTGAPGSVHDIKKRDVIDLVSRISERNSHAGYRLLKTLKTFFRWCVGRAVIEASPQKASPRTTERSAEIVL